MGGPQSKPKPEAVCYGESGGNGRTYDLAERYRSCDPFAERDLDADIFMVAEGAKEVRKEPLARIAINKVKQGSSVASAEGQTHVAIHAPDFGLINQRRRKTLVARLLTLDGCSLYPPFSLGSK